MILSRYLDYREDVGVELGTTYLKAGERDSYIYLISPKGYYTDTTPDTKNKRSVWMQRWKYRSAVILISASI